MFKVMAGEFLPKRNVSTYLNLKSSLQLQLKISITAKLGVLILDIGAVINVSAINFKIRSSL